MDLPITQTAFCLVMLLLIFQWKRLPRWMGIVIIVTTIAVAVYAVVLQDAGKASPAFFLFPILVVQLALTRMRRGLKEDSAALEAAKARRREAKASGSEHPASAG